MPPSLVDWLKARPVESTDHGWHLVMVPYGKPPHVLARFADPPFDEEHAPGGSLVGAAVQVVAENLERDLPRHLLVRRDAVMPQVYVVDLQGHVITAIVLGFIASERPPETVPPGGALQA